jgi:septal ring factor EnvC (AmiA/AmiB activator)
MGCEGLQGVKEHLANIDGKLEAYNKLLDHHIRRTDQMEDFVKEQQSNNNKIIDKIITQSNVNQASLNKQLKISLGIFAALAVLVSALAAWLS